MCLLWQDESAQVMPLKELIQRQIVDHALAKVSMHAWSSAAHTHNLSTNGTKFSVGATPLSRLEIDIILTYIVWKFGTIC